MIKLGMEYLEPLSFESMMGVQDSNNLYSGSSIPSVQSWSLAPPSHLAKHSPSSNIHEPPLSQDTCVLTGEALSSLSSSTYQSRVFCSFYDTGSRHSGIRKGDKADADGFITCFKARVHDEFNDNYALGHGLRKHYFDFKDRRDGFATTVGKLVADYDKTHDQHDVFEFTQSVRTDSEGNPDQLVNSSGSNPVGIPHGDEKLNKSAKSQGKANDDLEDDVNQAASELENEGAKLSDDAMKLLNACNANKKHKSSRKKKKKKKKQQQQQQQQSRPEKTDQSKPPQVKNAVAASFSDLLLRQYRDFFEFFGEEDIKSILRDYHTSDLCPKEFTRESTDGGAKFCMVTSFGCTNYLTNFALFIKRYTAVTNSIMVAFDKTEKEFKVMFEKGMDYPAAGDGRLSAAVVDDILNGVFNGRRSINSYATEIAAQFSISHDYVNRLVRSHQLFTSFLGQCLIRAVLSLLPKASTDETPASVLSIQGRSKVSDEIRSNMSEDDVSHITDTSQPYDIVWKSNEPEIPAVACTLSFGRGVFNLETSTQMFWTDVESVINGGDLICLKQMLTDGFQAYVCEAARLGIDLFMCHAHGRREFFKSANPKALRSFIDKFDKEQRIRQLKSYLKGNNSNIACSIILSLYGSFFAIEQKVQDLLEESRELKKGKDVTDENLVRAESCRAEAAGLRSGPMRELMDLIYDVIDTMREHYTFKNGKWVSTSKGNDYASACVYMLNNKEYFYKCIDNVDMVVHNNDTEQVMSGIALQRKNGYLTVSVKGAELNCATRSVIETMKANGKDIVQGLRDLSYSCYQELFTLVMNDELMQGNIGYNKEKGLTYSNGVLPMPDENRLLEMLPGIDFKTLIPALFNETAQSAIKKLGNSKGDGDDDGDEVYKKINERAHVLLKEGLNKLREQKFRTIYASIDRHESNLNDLEEEFNRLADEYDQHAQSAAASDGKPESGANSAQGTSPEPDVDHGAGPGAESGACSTQGTSPGPDIDHGAGPVPESGACSAQGTSPGPDIDHGSGPGPESGACSAQGTSPGPDIDHGSGPGDESGNAQDNQTQSELSEAELEEISQLERSEIIIALIKSARNTDKHARIKSSTLERALTGEQGTEAEAQNAKADQFVKEEGLFDDYEYASATGNRPLSVKSFLSFINDKIGHGIDRCTLMQHDLESDTSSGDYDLKLVKEVIEPAMLKKFTCEQKLLSNTDRNLRSRGMAGSNISYSINFLIDRVSVAWHKAQKATGEIRENLRKIAVHSINWLSSFLKDCREHMNIVFFQIAEDARLRSLAIAARVERLEHRAASMNIPLPPKR